MTWSSPAGRHHAVDATRGLALLGSAVATGLLWLGARQLGPGHRPVGGTDADRLVDGVLALLVDNRVLAVFALLLGHGLALRLARHDAETAAATQTATQTAAPAEAATSAAAPGAGGLVLRRAGLLVLVGAGHAVLLLDGDVLAVLGVVLVLAYPLVRSRTAVHVLVGLLVVPALLVHGVVDGLGGSVGLPDPPSDYLLSVVDRVGTWLLALVLLPFAQAGLVLAAVAGIRLARAGWLVDPAGHRRGLLLTGALGVGAGLAGAWPYAQVVAAGRTGDVAVSVGAGVLSSLTGPAAALGAVCLSVLALSALRGRGVGGLDGLALLGRRSLPVYLAHSAVLALVLAPWAGGAGNRWGSAAVAALGAGLWLLALLVATVAARRAGRTGGPDGPAGTDGPGGAQPTDRQGLARSSAT
ncbi:DUF418 domain-containing protein [Jannaschia sp. R86511]|uniref:DUF418 domain-containing protein n=1 Tax=Jannaschia sp. R86511 TaxID=3093853 RepID=UPI0036D3BD19